MFRAYFLDMNTEKRYAIFGFASALIIVFLFWLLWPTKKPDSKLSTASLDVPIVMHTSGGRLEVATVTVTEAFKFDGPPKNLLGLDLGKTVSHVQAKVVYRYYVEMEREWPVRFQGNIAVVEASEIKPTLPVAFDTLTMEKETKSGWARFDKHENLDELERRVGPELARRAIGYKALADSSARQTVRAFARTWLSKSQNWKSLKVNDVKVIFPGDPPAGETTLRPLPSDH
jgi:hypothetical protein